MSKGQAYIRVPKAAKIALGVILTPIVLVVLLAVALYLPPIQKWAVNKASEYASKETGMEISVDGVHLAFSLNLSLEEVRCLKQNDSMPQVKDTIAMVRQAIVDVQLLPLLSSNVVINHIELNQGHFNTSDFIPEARVNGYVGRLMVDNTPPPVATVALDSSVVRLSSIILTDARVNVELSDTVPPDTTETENLWKIYVKQFTVHNSQFTVHMPGDTLQIGATLGDAKAREGFFDLNKGLYQVNHLTLAKSAITYDNNFEPRQPHSANYFNAFDANHIALSDLKLRVDSICYQDPADIRLKIMEAAMKEQCGLELKSLRANVALDSVRMRVDGMIATQNSNLTCKVDLMSAETLRAKLLGKQGSRQDSKPQEEQEDKGTYDNLFDFDNNSVDAKIDGSIGYKDLKMILASTVQGFNSANMPMYPLSVKGEVHGNMKQMDIRQMNISWPATLTADAKGTVSMKPRMSARIHTDVKTYNLNFVKSMLDRSTARMINIPAMRADADIVYNENGDIDVNLKAYEGRGTLTANINGNVNSASMTDWNIDAKANGLNVNHFVKGYDLSNIDATASLHGGRLVADVNSHAGDVVGQFGIAGTMGKTTDVTLTTDLKEVNLYTLKITDRPLTIGLCSHLNINTDMDQYYKVQGMVSDISVTDTATTYYPDAIILDILTRRDTTMVKVDCGDFALRMNAQGGYKWLMGCSDRLQAEIDKQLKARAIDQQALRKCFPRLTASVHSGQDNPVYRSLKYMDIDYSLIDLSMRTSREDGIFSDLRVEGLKTQGYQLDTIAVAIGSRNDPMQIYYRAHIQNRPPNDYVFNALIDGKLLEHGVVTGVRLYDQNDELALRLGAEATMEENGIKLHFVPKNPTLGYDEFTLNDDNYLLLDKKNRIHAYIDLLAHDGTGLKVYSKDNDDDDDNDDYLQDLTLSVNKLNLGRLLSALPYAVNMQGTLNGDFHVMQNMDETFALASDLDISNMVYEGCKIGNIGTEFTYLPKSDGSHFVDGIVLKDDVQVGNITGSYNFNTSAINAKMNFNKFPLDIINGFIPDQLIGLEGTAEGTLDINGTTSKPDVNGELFLENAALLSVPYGMRMRFDNDPVRIQNSNLLFENFQMYASNDQPMLVHGSLNFSDLDHITVDMRLRAEDFALIDAEENSKSETYGNLNVNCYARINGELDRLNVRGRLDVLPSTNLYYILRDSPITTDNRLDDLVTFTDFENSDTMKIVRPVAHGMNLNMSIAVREGAHIKCWLDGAHSNYLDLVGNGELRYVFINDETKMTGRYTITEGEMKYSLPVIPLKTFTIEDGSYIEWTGEMMNPRLHITAKETVKSNVNIDGVNQMVTFLTGVKLSKTLNDMGLEFIIEAPENQTISDELNMKSTEERGRLAVTMLTTGMYLSDGNTSKFSMNSALNSFLQSEINHIAGNALKTIDLSFGMESSTEQDGTMHNDYTFKFAKRFWNNRLSIAVGGKVSSGPDVSGQNKSFFNNVDLQYRLSDTSNKYLQMFYKRAVYDYLEGYLSQYGAGYMWKRKSQTFKGIFQKEPKLQFRRGTPPARQDSTKVK